MVISRHDQITLLGQCVMIVVFLLLCKSYTLSAGEILQEAFWKKTEGEINLDFINFLCFRLNISSDFTCHDIDFPSVSTDKIKTSLNLWTFYKDSLFSHSYNLD